MRKLTSFLVVGLGLVWASTAWGVAAQLSNTAQTRVNSENVREMQLIRCEQNNATDTPLGGEFCESGDWSLPMYCGDMSNIRVTFIEYGDGSGEAKLWNCLKVGSTSTGGGSLPGTEAPSAAPGAGDPDPLCMDLTLAAGVTLNGTNAGTQFLNLDGQQVQYLVGEIQTCTANCDSTLIVSCGR